MQRRREFIIQNAFQMFSERRIEVVRISEIARKSRVSDNTIYRYFENKENLVRAVPEKSRYQTVEDGVLCALSNGWNVLEDIYKNKNTGGPY